MLLSNRVPMARAGLQVGKVCSNLISSCCPKEGTVLHIGLIKMPDGGEEEEEGW